MKQPWEWNEDDLLALIANGTQESIELEYKACDALSKTEGKKNELSKDVSAFANSAGGTLIYGMIENGHTAERLDVGFDPCVISKEWLDQVINSRIQRRIDGIRISQVELTNTNPGKVAYVVHVPQSLRAPHQAADKRFYKRFNFESVPMEEYEIRDVAHRFETPDLQLTLRLSQSDSQVAPLLNASVENKSDTPAQYAVIAVSLDARLRVQNHDGILESHKPSWFEIDERRFSCTTFIMKWAVPGKLPLFRGVGFSLLDHPLKIDAPVVGRYYIGWQIHSPGMKMKQDAAFLVWDGTRGPGPALTNSFVR